MASQTSALPDGSTLTKPAYTDSADIAVINTNMDKIVSNINAGNSDMANKLSFVSGAVSVNSTATITLSASSSVVIFVTGNASSRFGAFIGKSNAGSTAAYLLELASGSDISATTSNGKIQIVNSGSAGAFIYVIVFEGGASIS